ncbi:MAG: class I adenylate cyclase [Pseudomonadales bacterium]|nr:class I adenylate cyclase [Pseudomonadales bacterium]
MANQRITKAGVSGTIKADIHAGLDRKALKHVVARFMQVNDGRIERIREALTAQQRFFLDLLPLLFHVNHPLLPGYVSHQTPSGVSGYRPDKRALNFASQVTRSFKYLHNPHDEGEIYAIYLMGSCGTIGHSRGSDLDIWLCHRPGISAEKVEQLNAKAVEIERWSEQFQLEVHFFVIDHQLFKLQQHDGISDDGSGSTQHFLLLDEFYRTALLIAGRYPIWWLVPAESEHEYALFAQTLTHKRYIRATDTTDFGPIETIPAEEFVGASIWQLYKGIEKPHKSVLKLLLNEVYASQCPNVETLSIQFKRAIYDDQLDLNELDPYVMVYRAIESYLQKRGETQRLELVRRCFYFKVGLKLSSVVSDKNKTWQRKLIEKMAGDWGWNRGHLINLDSRKNWKITRFSEERTRLVNELTHSYRFVSSFARQHTVQSAADARELSILGRKLYAAYERKAGKIDQVSPGIIPGLLEENIEFRQNGEDAEQLHWQASVPSWSSGERAEFEVVKTAKSALELLGWCFINGVIDLSTHVQLEVLDSELTSHELRDVLMSLNQLMPQPLPKPEQQNFLRAALPVQYVVVINMGNHPMADLRKKGLQRLSNHNNALDYSGVRRNLVVAIDQLALNSWNEVSSQSYDGPSALLDFLRDHLQLWSTNVGQIAPKLDIRCFSAGYAGTIKTRIEQLFADLFASYSGGEGAISNRYLLEIGQQYCCFQQINGRFQYRIFEDDAALLAGLEQPQSSYSPAVFDRFSMGNSELAAVYQSCRRGFIQFFYRADEEIAQIYVVDENGALIQYQTAFYDQDSLLVPFQRFIESVLVRLDSSSIPVSLPDDRVHYYEIMPAVGQRAPTIESRRAPARSASESYLHIQAMVETSSGVAPHYSLFCDGREFSSIEHGSQLYGNIVKYILSLRKNGERYPCYITDLDLSTQVTAERLSSFHFLYYKKNLESVLNKLLLSTE